MSFVSTEDVVALYSKYPYPSPVVGRTLAYDIANLFMLLCGDDDLAGRKVLDAGCGTGQRVVGFARQYPLAEVQGIDATEVSLRVGRELAERHAVRNVTFQRRDIMNLELDERFDFIISTGVVHCLQDPRRGLQNLCRHLADDGMICIWHYHPLGEFERLAGREVLLTLWGEDRSDLAVGQRLMEQLELRLHPEQYGYGANAAQPDSRRGQLSATVDAYMHPIVNAYRFDEAMAMFRDCGVDWVAINGINTPDTMKLIDLGGVEELGREFCLRGTDLFQAGELRDRFDALSPVDRLKVIELMMKPTGYTILAGRGNSLGRLSERVAGNAVAADALPEPYPRLFRV